MQPSSAPIGYSIWIGATAKGRIEKNATEHETGRTGNRCRDDSAVHARQPDRHFGGEGAIESASASHAELSLYLGGRPCRLRARLRWQPRSEEHTSELQSLRHLVCR